MIKLTKLPEPGVLRDNRDKWTEALLARTRAGEQPTKAEKSRYSHHEIKAALVAETNGKCAYCESKLRHITYGDIEHIVPKSAVVELWFDWVNLTLACDVCNTKKSDFAHGLVDPYGADPETRFWLMGALLFARPGDDEASLTEKQLELNRPELIERRTERLKALMLHLEVIERARPELRAILAEDFRREGDANREFAALARELIRQADRRQVAAASME